METAENIFICVALIIHITHVRNMRNVRMKNDITVEPRYLELAYFELPLISKWKSGPWFNMKLWQQITK